MLSNWQHRLSYFLFPDLANLLNLLFSFLVVVLRFGIRISFWFRGFVVFVGSLYGDLLFGIRIVCSFLYAEFRDLVQFVSSHAHVFLIVLLASVEVSWLYRHLMILTFLFAALGLWSLLHILFLLLMPSKFLLMFHFLIIVDFSLNLLFNCEAFEFPHSIYELILTYFHL